MNTKIAILATGAILGIFALTPVSQIAHAQYLPTNGQTGLDEYVKIAEDRVKIASDNPGTGSGTPIFAADGVVGALLLSSGVFGGIATAFFVRGRQGKYAAMGRG